MVGDEATYLMQAQSLAFDGDFFYYAGDYRRFVALWHGPPGGLILQSNDEGATIAFGKPPFYAAVLAPFVRIAPVRGPFVANALLVALAAVASARALSRRVGPAAPLWVAAFLFASVTFAFVFWAHADLFLMVLVALALALGYGWDGATGPTAGPPAWSCSAGRRAGALIALVALSRPFYATLFLPVALAATTRSPRPRARAAGAAGAGSPLSPPGRAGRSLVAVGLSLALHGHWTSYSGERMGFYSYTGFPDVDFPASAWSDRLAERGGPGSWIAARSLQIPVLPKVTAWNVLYFLAGRDVGLLPYFLPRSWAWPPSGPAAGAGRSSSRSPSPPPASSTCGRSTSMAAAARSPTATSCRSTPRFWFLAAGVDRRWRPAWTVAAPLAVTLLAAPFLWPLWTAPRAYPHLPGGGYRYVAPAARVLLPYETTLDHLKPSGHEDVRHNGLWIKSLDPTLDPAAPGGWLELVPGGSGARAGRCCSGRPAASTLRLELAPPAPAEVEVEGAAPSRWSCLASSGIRRSAFLLTPGPARAHHRMWWTEQPFWLYQLGIGIPPGEMPPGEPVRFRLMPSPAMDALRSDLEHGQGGGGPSPYSADPPVPDRADVGVVVGRHHRPVAGHGPRQPRLVVVAEDRRREQDLELPVERQERLEQHRLGPDHRPLGADHVLLGRVGHVVGEVDVVAVDHDPRAQPGQQLEIEVGHVAVDLDHVGRVDEQHVAGLEPPELVRVDVLDLPAEHLDAGQAGHPVAGVGVDAGDGAGAPSGRFRSSARVM